MGIPEGASLRSYDARRVSIETGVNTGIETLVQQQFAEDADINVLVHRFGVTGQMPLGPSAPGIYGDFTGIFDYESARETIRRADQAFMQLSAEVRAKFDNDPQKLIDFARSASYEDFVAGVEAAKEPPAPAEPV